MNSPFDHLVKHATQPTAPSEPAPDKRPGRTFKLLELINQHPGISTEALSKQSGVCSQQIWTKLQRHLARGHVFHEAGAWRMSPDAPQLREVHQAIALLRKHGFSVQEPAAQEVDTSATDVLLGMAADDAAQIEVLSSHLRSVIEIARTWQPGYATKMDRDTLDIAQASLPPLGSTITTQKGSRNGTHP